MLDLGAITAEVGLDTGRLRRDEQQAGQSLDRLARRIERVPDVQVDADTGRAEARLQRVASTAGSLPDGEVEVTADTDRAERALDGLGDDAESGLGDAGRRGGDAMGGGILDSLKKVAVVGSVVGIGTALAASFLDGFSDEVRRDMFSARTGLDEETARKFGRAAGEAYAGNFGESVESNLDVARAAVQGGLLDADSTQRESQDIIASLTSVADVLGEDVGAVVRTVSTLLRNDFADSADDAFDILVTGQQKGANVAQDLLDTFNEYPSVLRGLGLDGATSLGLMNQAIRAGARDSDFAADALKEFQIRATDGSETSARAFEALGLSAEGMTAKIARGGASAREGLDQVLDGLRAVEDPVVRNAAAVGLFGTKAEDLGASLDAMDVDTAAADMDQLAGSAARAADTMGDNTAGSVAGATRSIAVALDAVKAAAAEAFGPQISEWADQVSQNRAGLTKFFVDVINGAFDLQRALIEAAASGVEGFGELVELSAPLADMFAGVIDGAAGLAMAGGRFGLAEDLRESADTLRDASKDMEGFTETTDRAAATLRNNLIGNGLDPAQEKFNELGDAAIVQAELADATNRTARTIEGLADSAAGAARDSEALNRVIGRAVGAMRDQARAGVAAGQSTEELTSDYRANRRALEDQLVSMGIARNRAREMIRAYDDIPDRITTRFREDGGARVLRTAERIARAVRDASGTVTTYFRQVRQGDAPVRGISARASGGPIRAGHPYLVGEAGPELVVPSSSGTVLSAGQTRAALGGGGTVRVVVEAGAGDDLTRALARRIRATFEGSPDRAFGARR